MTDKEYNAVIKIENRQRDESGEETVIPQEAECSYHLKNGKLYIRYEETEHTVEQGVTTMIKADGKEVKIRRDGAYQMTMRYRTGMTDAFLYSMPYGQLPMRLVTQKAVWSGGEQGAKIYLEYTLEANGGRTENQMRITVRTKNA